MELQSRYTVNKEKVVFRVLEGEAKIINVDNGYYYNLNGVGTEIWDALGKGKSLAEILAFLKEEYGLAENALKNDLLKLVKDLEKEKLVKAT